jgi:peptidoglycan hydrolase CwlO-like protein
MDPDSRECYEYLSDQAVKLDQEEIVLQKKLDDAEYQVLSLSQKIAYITTQIAETEKIIEVLEIEIAKNDVQIKLLEKDILESEDYISLMQQETRQLEQTVNQRVTESYKYSFVGPMEIFLDSKGLGSMLRKVKYLASTRQQDKQSLEQFSEQIEELKTEEEKLQKQQAELQVVRNALAEDKTEIYEEKQNLASQKAEKNSLLAQSKAQQATLITQLEESRELQAAIDNQILAYINAHLDEAVDEGPVAKGSIIGYVYPYGNSCSGSTGPHLHFAASTISTNKFYPNIDLYANGYFSIGGPSGIQPGPLGWNWPFLLAGKYIIPIAGSGVYITQDYHDPNNDYVKQSWEYQYYATDLSKLGGSANAPVLAVAAGNLQRGVDPCGQHYAIITHANGYRTIYVHLK